MTAQPSFSWDDFEETPGPYSSSQSKDPQAEKTKAESFSWDQFDDVPFYKSIPAAAVKGLTKGIIGLGESFGPLIQTPKQRKEESTQREETLSKILPSNSNLTEKYVERAGKILPGVLAGPGGIPQALARTGLAAAGGQTAEELGFEELGQTIAELPALIAPGLKGKITPSAGQKEIVSEARRLGLSEKEIAPLIQGEKKQSALKRFAAKGDYVQGILKNSKKAVDTIYETIGESSSAKNIISPDISKKMDAVLKREIGKLPSELQKKIAPDLNDLMKGDITGEKLINFYQDLNHYISKGDSKLGKLKDPIVKAMEGVSPEFAQDFKIANDLYARSAKIRKTLNKKDESIVSQFLEATAPYQLMGAVASGYYPAIVGVLGEIGGRHLATAMLTNPRLQNLTTQMIHAVSENKIQLAQNLKKVLQSDLEKISPESALLIEYLDFNQSSTKDRNT